MDAPEVTKTHTKNSHSITTKPSTQSFSLSLVCHSLLVCQQVDYKNKP